MEDEQQDLPIRPDTSPKGIFSIELRALILNIFSLIIIIKVMLDDPETVMGASPRLGLITFVLFVTVLYIIIRLIFINTDVQISLDEILVMKRNKIIYRNATDNIDYILRKVNKASPPMRTYTIVFSDGNGIMGFHDDGTIGPDDHTIRIQGRPVPIVDQRPVSKIASARLGICTILALLLFLIGPHLLWPSVDDRLVIAFQGHFDWIPLAAEAFVFNAIFITYVSIGGRFVIKHKYPDMNIVNDLSLK